MDEATFELVIQDVAAGNGLMVTLEKREVPYTTFRRFLLKDPTRRIMLAHARSDASHVLADEAKTIADTELDAQRARNRMDIRKWLAQVFNRQQFGDKVDLSITDALNPAALHAEGLKRARLMRDLNALPEQQGTDDALVIEHGATGNTSAPALPGPHVPSIFD